MDRIRFVDVVNEKKMRLKTLLKNDSMTRWVLQEVKKSVKGYEGNKKFIRMSLFNIWQARILIGIFFFYSITC